MSRSPVTSFASPASLLRPDVAVVTDRPDLRAVATGAAGAVPGCRVVSVAADAAAGVPGRFGAAVVGVDALPALAAAGRAGSRCRLVVLTGTGDDPGPAWPAALALGAERLVGPVDDGGLESWLADLGVTQAAAIGVVGGRGGAGASTAAVALARAAAVAEDGSVLVDADPVGGGLDLALGAETVGGLRWPDLATAPGVTAQGLLGALPRVDDVAVVSHARDHGPGSPRDDSALVAAVLDTCLTAGVPVVVDLPRRGDATTLAALARCSSLVVVVPAEVRACAAAAALLDEVAGAVRDVRLLVRGPAPAGLTAEDVAAALGVPTFAEVRPEPGLAAALDRGERVAVSARSPLRVWAAATVAATRGRTR